MKPWKAGVCSGQGGAGRPGSLWRDVPSLGATELLNSFLHTAFRPTSQIALTTCEAVFKFLFLVNGTR